MLRCAPRRLGMAYDKLGDLTGLCNLFSNSIGYTVLDQTRARRDGSRGRAKGQ
jgi:hypothetical protein